MTKTLARGNLTLYISKRLARTLPDEHRSQADEAQHRRRSGLRFDAEETDESDHKADHAVDRVPEEDSEAHSQTADDRDGHHIS